MTAVRGDTSSTGGSGLGGQSGGGQPELDQLRDLREANENLVLAMLGIQELQERAERALAASEEAMRSLRETARELRETVDSQGTLLGIVSHDLRTPVGTISACAELLVRQGQLSDSNAELVGMVSKSIRRMELLIHDLLDFTRIRLGGGLSLERDSADMRRICEEALAELALQAPVPLRSDFAGDLFGTWDAGRLAELLSNLLVNAIEHAAAGSCVVLRAVGEGEHVVVEVSNQGPAIPEEMLSIIFEPFRRVHRQERARVQNLGLGLYIGRQIVVAHGGTIAVTSAGGTTTFRVCLPRAARAR